MLSMPGAELNGTRRARAIPMQAKGITPTMVMAIMRAYSARLSETCPMEMPITVRMLTMMTPNTMAEQHFARTYAMGGMGLARFRSSQPAASSLQRLTPTPNSEAPTM